MINENVEKISRDPKKQEMLTLMQSYAVAYSTQDKNLVKLVTDQTYQWLSEVSISPAKAPSVVEELPEPFDDDEDWKSLNPAAIG